jgi:hypothetical protein
LPLVTFRTTKFRFPNKAVISFAPLRILGESIRLIWPAK